MAPDLPDPRDLTLSVEYRRSLVRWASDCVRRLLPVFERAAPQDARLRQALAGTDDFVRGELGVGPMRRLALGCHAAAREVEDPAAVAVARAFGHAVASAHMGAHSRNIARYTAKALGPEAAEELAWQREHLPGELQTYVYGDAGPCVTRPRG